MKTQVLLIFSAVFFMSCAHLVLNMIVTQRSWIRFMVRHESLDQSAGSRWSPELRDKFVQADELQPTSQKVQRGYKECVEEALNAIDAVRRVDVFLVCLTATVLVLVSVVVYTFPFTKPRKVPSLPNPQSAGEVREQKDGNAPRV